MRSQGVFALALGLALLGHYGLSAEAAKKYYPPGFKPPSDNALVPSPAPAEPQPQVIIQQVPGSKQVIIKTVPVKVEKVISQPARPRDPLLMLMDEHRYYDALRLVDARLKKSPGNVSLQMTRGRILREQGSYQQSIAQFQAVLDKSHSKSIKASAYNGLGWTYYRKAIHSRQVGDEAGALAGLTSSEAAFRSANQLSPSMPYALAGLGKVALANGKLKDAAHWVKQAKRYAPNAMEVQLVEAELLLAQQKPEEALQILYGIKKTTTHEPDVFLFLAKGSFDTGKIDDAIINLKQLLGMVPDHTEALTLLSRSYELKMKPEDAEVTLERAIALNPMDEKSVASLLKIYDQRHEKERGMLLLRTLLKDRPGQQAYGLELLSRLMKNGNWDDVYEEGAKILPSALTNEPDSAATRGLVAIFSQAVYQKGRGMLDRQALMNEPAVKQAKAYVQADFQKTLSGPGHSMSRNLEDRLNLLLMDPLTPLPPLLSFTPTDEQDLLTLLQISFLTGNQELHDQLLPDARKLDNKQQMANQLYCIGDYEGARALVAQILEQHPDSTEALQLQSDIAATEKKLEEQRLVLSMLPRKLPASYWQRAAQDVLVLGTGDWETHAMVGKMLQKRHRDALALRQQKLAAQYAPTPKEKAYWQRRAEKTARALARNKAKDQ
ncbi:MAG: Tetratricopeptide repeat [Vampirovibrio sp.]|jgi:tetratricopeptide (TPR) repeat protein|nr:Tetratricopeptide repeat [Vampirovibrio sp.]